MIFKMLIFHITVNITMKFGSKRTNSIKLSYILNLQVQKIKVLIKKTKLISIISLLGILKYVNVLN